MTWLVSWHPQPATRPVLLCFPPAGAGCGQFATWQRALGDDVSVIGVQLPGRETRWADPDASTMDEAVAELVTELLDLLPARHPVVVFGHSFGALLGYLTVRLLRARWDAWPRALVVSACRPPRAWVGAGRGLVDDEAELTALLDARGLEPDDLDEDSRDLMLDVLRRDARLSLSFTEPVEPAVGCALESWGGKADTTVSPEHVEGWQSYAGAEFRSRLFDGGHYFSLAEPDRPLALLRELACGAPAGANGGPR
jgi:surfactin synthase thioesterase subunit